MSLESIGRNSGRKAPWFCGSRLSDQGAASLAPDVEITFVTPINPSLGEEVKVTVIATGRQETLAGAGDTTRPRATLWEMPPLAVFAVR